MGIYLAGGHSTSDTAKSLWTRFLNEARTQAGDDTVVAVIAVGADGAESAQRIIDQADPCGDAHYIVINAEHGQCSMQDISTATALVVADGDTRAYRAALEPISGELRRRVSGDAPYFGIGAGARVAAEKAIVGGWKIGSVPVAPESAAEGLDEVTIEQGLGLLDLSIEIAPVAHGTLSRLVAATEAGLVGGGIGIDYDTAFVIADGRLEVVGSGSIWQVLPDEHGVKLSTRGA